MDKILQLYNEETGVRMDFVVLKQIPMIIKNEERLFLVLSPLHRTEGSWWDRMMEDPERDLCILEKKETRGGGISYLRVEDDLLMEVSERFAAAGDAGERSRTLVKDVFCDYNDRKEGEMS